MVSRFSPIFWGFLIALAVTVTILFSQENAPLFIYNVF